MPLRITSAPVSGVKKRKAPATSRPRASPFAGHPRRKPTATPGGGSKSSPNVPDYEDLGPLPDIGVSHYIPETSSVQDVLQAIAYIRDNMFEELPARRAGMNSTRIAEVLNLRRSLPPLASVAHVHTLLNVPTKVEKEIMELINTGRIRRLTVPGRGNDAAGLGDCLVLAEDWERLVRESGLEPSLKGRSCIPYNCSLVCHADLCRQISGRPQSAREHLGRPWRPLRCPRIHGSRSCRIPRILVVAVAGLLGACLPAQFRVDRFAGQLGESERSRPPPAA